MLTPMTLKELMNKATVLNRTGAVMPSLDKMVAFQEMVWERILSHCTPLNLAIPYNDGGIARFSHCEDGVQWYVKSPVIAKNEDDYIDIDSRLKEAFVFYFIAFYALNAKDNNRAEFESRGDMACVGYECDVINMGLPNAKKVYEQYNGITGVQFNCYGARYIVDDRLIETIITCFLCGNVCANAAQFKQLEKYKRYLVYMNNQNNGDGTAVLDVLPSEMAALRGIDIAMLYYLMEHLNLVGEYGSDALDRVTTLSCELGKLSQGLEVADWVKAIDLQMGAETQKDIVWQ